MVSNTLVPFADPSKTVTRSTLPATVTASSLAPTVTRDFSPADLHQVATCVWVGGCGALTPTILTQRSIYNVINTARELQGNSQYVDWNALQSAGIRVHHVPWSDDYQQQLFPSGATNDAIMRIDSLASSGQHVLVNCAQGKSRSVSLVIAFLITRRGMTFDQALHAVRSQRPIVCPNPSFEYQLRNLERGQKQNAHNSHGHGHNHNHSSSSSHVAVPGQHTQPAPRYQPQPHAQSHAAYNPYQQHGQRQLLTGHAERYGPQKQPSSSAVAAAATAPTPGSRYPIHNAAQYQQYLAAQQQKQQQQAQQQQYASASSYQPGATVTRQQAPQQQYPVSQQTVPQYPTLGAAPTAPAAAAAAQRYTSATQFQAAAPATVYNNGSAAPPSSSSVAPSYPTLGGYGGYGSSGGSAGSGYGVGASGYAWPSAATSNVFGGGYSPMPSGPVASPYRWM